LRDLAGLYAGLARGGEAIELKHRLAAGEPLRASRKAAPKRLLSPAAAWYVSDILKDAPPPPSATGGRFAYKTGTSYGYRDAWAVGYDGAHTIAVWVGRADGASTPGLTGRVAAAPLLFDAFQRLGSDRAPLAQRPAGTLRVSGAELPPPLKRFAEPGQDGIAAGPFLNSPVLIAFPPDRSELELDEADDMLLLKAEGGALPLTWMVDGRPIASDPHRRQAVWQPGGRGFVKLTVTDAEGRVDRVSIRLR
jgi:penicillin-binding protein 1C